MTPSAPSVVTARDLTKSYKGRKALTGLNLDLEEGRIHGLLGRNGTGKSTLLSILAGQIPHEGGGLNVFGQAPFDNAHVMDRVVYAGIDVPFPAGWRPDTVFETAAQRYPGWHQSTAQDLVAEFGLDVHAKYAQLSRGQRSMVGVIVGLAARAPLTLLDEPYLGLDVHNRGVFYTALLREMDVHPRTVVLATHHIEESAKLLDTFLILGRDGLIHHHLDAGDLDDAYVVVSGPRLPQINGALKRCVEPRRGRRDGSGARAAGGDHGHRHAGAGRGTGGPGRGRHRAAGGGLIMTVTAVDSPLHVAWSQVRGIQRPGAVLLMLIVLVPWLLLVAGAGSAFYKLGTLLFLHLLVTSLLAGDRRIYRTLGLNRRGAVRQQLVISLPVLVVAGVLILPGLAGVDWLWVPVVAAVALAVDATITLNVMNTERRGKGTTINPAWVGPARSGGMVQRLLWVPMLRWVVPSGMGIGLVLGFGEDPEGSAVWSLLVAACFMGAVFGPSIEVISGTASLATWQSLGLPRRVWSRTVTLVAILAPVLALLIALGVLGVLALWNVTPWEVVRQVVSATPALTLLWAGVSVVSASLGGGNGVHGGAAVGATGPFLLIFSLNTIEDPTLSAVLFVVVTGVVLLVVGLYLQHGLVHAANGTRATLDTRKFTD